MSSDRVPVESGLPQGSVLAIGPSLFLFYVNDMPEGLTSTVRLFTDDTIAYIAITSDADTNTLQKDLDKLAEWQGAWFVKFHPEKCNVLTITKNCNIKRKDYILQGHILEHVTSAKYLGVTITSDLKWSQHINNISTKANNTICFLKRLQP